MPAYMQLLVAAALGAFVVIVIYQIMVRRQKFLECRKWEELARKRDLDTEQIIERILANPDLAVLAFPNPELREKVLPLLKSIRLLNEEAEARNPKRGFWFWERL